MLKIPQKTIPTGIIDHSAYRRDSSSLAYRKKNSVSKHETVNCWHLCVISKQGN